jgi:uncharacterized membrane protein
MRSIYRLFIALGLSIGVFFILLVLKVEVFTRIVVSWDLFALIMIIWLWRIFFKMGSDELRTHARIEDNSRTVTFFIIIATVIISLMGILILLNNRTKGLVNPYIHAPVSIIGVGISWMLLHSVFTSRYAHLYYGGSSIHDDPNEICGGIEFPGGEAPDYMDFAYFAFVIGMTFQVSDTNITFKKIRRNVLFHGLLSFIYNTIIVAISISVIINLI